MASFLLRINKQFAQPDLLRNKIEGLGLSSKKRSRKLKGVVSSKLNSFLYPVGKENLYYF